MPMNYLFVVTALQPAGIPAWWIGADPDHARKAFVAREAKKPERKRIPVGCFEAQMSEILRQCSLLDRVFGKNMVDGLNADGSQRAPGELWAEIERRSNG